MVVVILGFYKRKPGLSREQFREHWEKIHGPLIRGLPDVEKYLIRYVQHHIQSDSQYPVPSGADFDGFSEAWWVDHESMTRFLASPAFQATKEDEEKFLDLSATRWIVNDDQKVIISGIENSFIKSSIENEVGTEGKAA